MPPKFSRPGFSRGGESEAESKRALLGGNSDDDGEDYEDFDPSGVGKRGRGGRGPAAPRDDAALRRARQEVSDVVEIMRQNVSKVLERGDHLEDIEDKSERLMDSSIAFKRGTKKLTWNMWWQHIKYRIFIIVGVIITLLIIIVKPQTSNDGRV
eukprot:m.329865 g.329865  ORF g.329865 m.329865 type:complete len:154 (+) comp19758_c0_seq8:119-580(+)